ncbi:unnamed protein product [Arabidopsis lyrata]|nr:unnamed protein product [Arabidopsis lyrata]
MERSNNIELRNSFYGRARTSPWSYGDYDNYQQDHEYLLGFSWPPRSYTCSFCKREFRSAQALGGHMNVHRRDRARLRLQQSSSSSSTPSPPYPNPNYSYSSMATSPPPHHSPLTLFPTLSPPSSPRYRPVEAGEAKRFTSKDACKILRNDDIISLELEIGLIKESEQDLDLELRLGFA